METPQILCTKALTHTNSSSSSFSHPNPSQITLVYIVQTRVQAQLHDLQYPKLPNFVLISTEAQPRWYLSVTTCKHYQRPQLTERINETSYLSEKLISKHAH